MKIVVLDLDETLISSVPCFRYAVKCNPIFSDGYLHDIHIRPYVSEFIDWCFDNNLEIVVFSAAYSEYVSKITSILFDGKRKQPLLVMDGEYLEIHQVTGDYTKSLRNVESLLKEKNPNLRDENMEFVVIDDSKKNYINFEMRMDDRVFLIPEWDGEDDNDRCIKDAQLFIMEKLFQDVVESLPIHEQD